MCCQPQTHVLWLCRVWPNSQMAQRRLTLFVLIITCLYRYACEKELWSHHWIQSLTLLYVSAHRLHIIGQHCTELSCQKGTTQACFFFEFLEKSISHKHHKHLQAPYKFKKPHWWKTTNLVSTAYYNVFDGLNWVSECLQALSWQQEASCSGTHLVSVGFCQGSRPTTWVFDSTLPYGLLWYGRPYATKDASLVAALICNEQ